MEKRIQAFLGDRSFEEAAIWMDVIRSDHSYNYMSPWHFVNIERNCTYKEDPKGDAASELNLVIKELRQYKSMNTEDVKKDLEILFHLCGDITQPLHVGYGSDKGGNTITLNYNNAHTNLHHIWDTDIIISKNITVDSCLAVMNNWNIDQINIIKKIDVMQWMNDSRALLPLVYRYENGNITQDYINANEEIIKAQICKGGLRLASVLNEILKNE